MGKKELKTSEVYLNIARLMNFLKQMGVRLNYFFLSVVLSTIAVLFQIAVIRLLFPLARGIIGGDLSFVRGMSGLKNIINRFPQTFNTSGSLFILLVIVTFIAAVLKNVLQYAASLSVSYQAKHASSSIRKLIFRRYLRFGKSFFDCTGIGSLNTTLMKFTKDITSQITLLQRTFGQLLSLLVYLTIMFIISWKMTIFVIVIFPVLSYSSKWTIEKIKNMSKLYADSHRNLSNKIFNILSCISLVKAYAKEEEEEKHFFDISDKEVELAFSMDKKNQLIDPLQDIAMLIALLLAASAMTFITPKSQTGSIADYLVFFFILRKSVPAFGALNNFKASIAKAHGPVLALSEILDDKDKFIIPDGQREFGGLKREIRFNNLNFSYPERNTLVLKNVSLSIKKGEMTAIVGPTGSGKTTLINLMVRFYDCADSSIMIDGIDIKEFTLKSLRNKMALVSQDVFIFDDTIRKNIAYSVDGDISDEELIDVSKRARLHDFIMRLPKKFDTYVGDRGVKLSGGEKQRVAIARALLKGAEILILDEATSSLDTKTERLIQEAINEAIKDRTAIVIAHRLSTIKRADKIVVIENGGLIEQGSLDELLEKKGTFYQHWEEQRF